MAFTVDPRMMLFAHDVPSAVGREECEHLASAASGRRVLEVGSEFGRSTIALASTALVVHSVGWHLGDDQSGFKDSLPAFIENLARYGVRERVTMHVGRWEEVSRVFRPHTFDMAFLDGDHSETAITRDLALLDVVVAPGSRILLHDADQPQVREAAERFAESRRARIVPAAGTLLELHLPSLRWEPGESSC